MKNKSKAPLIATVIVAVLAVAAVVALIIVLNSTDGTENPSSSEDSGFTVTKEFQQECEYAAHDLISASFEVMRLYVFEGLSTVSEPYGNEPEDGYYNVYTEDNGKYNTLEDIEKLVKSVYTEDAAYKIMHNIDGNGFEVFKNRKDVYVGSEVLGMSADFIPNTSKRDLWANLKFQVTPKSETNCEMKIYLGVVEENADLSEVDESRIAELEMVKTADGWRFSDFVC